jgi:alginate O-acetyltransferase complex protein AlgI
VNFASPAFFAFLPVALAGYYRLPSRALKYRFLLAASWFFYAFWNPWYLWVLLLPTAVDYGAGRLIEEAPTPGRRRLWLGASIALNLGLLAGFKYTAFAARS